MYYIRKDLIGAEDFSVVVYFFFFFLTCSFKERDTTEIYGKGIEKFRIQPEIKSRQSASQV